MPLVLKVAAAGLAILVGCILFLAALKPDTFLVQRSATVRAAPDRIYPLINDLHRFNEWNPYRKKDPNMAGEYRGAPQGKGAAYAFAGNKDVGRGSLEIVEAEPPSAVRMRLEMVEPFEARNTVEFTLRALGDGTRVTWTMRGHQPFVAKVIHLFLDVDSMVGRDFETGLADLKTLAERS